MRVLGFLVVPIVLVALLTGCGSGKELKTAVQAGDFIEDIARGGSIDNWAHEVDAVGFADDAWYNRSTIERLGIRIRNEGDDWVCDTAEGIGSVSDLVEIIGLESTAEREAILASAAENGVGEYEASSLIEEILDLANNEAVETVGAACDAAEGF